MVLPFYHILSISLHIVDSSRENIYKLIFENSRPIHIYIQLPSHPRQQLCLKNFSKNFSSFPSFLLLPNINFVCMKEERAEKWREGKNFMFIPYLKDN